MARPQKQTVEYFPHICDTENGKTLSVLQNKYGNDGYAFWFRLLEFLGKRDGLYFDYNNPADLEFLCAKTHQNNTETLLLILNDLDILGAIDHELYQEKVIWCQKFVDGVADAFARSVAGVPQRPTPKTVNVLKPDQSVVKTGQSVDKNPKNDTETSQRKLKEIKVKETKEEKESVKEPSLTGLPEKKIYGEFQNVILKDEEYEKLSERFSKEWVDEYIEKLSGYQQQSKANAKKYTDHYATLRNWLLRDGKEIKDSPGRVGMNGMIKFDADTESAKTIARYDAIKKQALSISQVLAMPDIGEQEHAFLKGFPLDDTTNLSFVYFVLHGERQAHPANVKTWRETLVKLGVTLPTVEVKS
jgi:hypothetical protein